MHNFWFSRKKTDFPPTLSTQARANGRALIWRFYALNGISIAFLMDNILILYAIRNGVSDPLVAVLSSFVHLTMPFMIIGKLTIARIGAAKNWSFGWFMRYLSASFLILAPIIAPFTSQAGVSAVILASAFGFALFRSMGVVSSSPMEGEVTTPENRGRFLSGNHLRVNASQILAMLLLILITSVTDELWVYQMVIGAACITGIYASTVLAKIPESEMPRKSAQKPLGKAFKKLWKNKSSRKLLFAWSAGLVSFMMVIPFMMIAVKSGYGISDYAALTFSLVLLLGGIISSLVNGMIADQVGPRPLLLMNTAGLLISAGMWAFTPTQFLPAFTGISFFIAGFCKMGIILGINHYFLSSIDDSDRVGSSLIIRVISGAAAGLIGSVIGGGLLSYFEFSGIQGLDVYRYFFRIMIILLLAMIFIVRSLDKLDEWPIKNILGLLLAPRDIYALHVLRRLRSGGGSKQDTKTVQRLGAIGSVVSEAELREQLNSPLLSVRVNSLIALGRISFGKKTEDAVLKELSCGEYTSAWIAAEIVGKHRIQRGIELLRHALSSPDPFLLGKSMVALVRLDDQESYPRIVQLFEESDNPRIVIYGATALSLMDGNEHLVRILKKSLQAGMYSSVKDEVLTAAASLAGIGERFYQFLQQYNQNKYIGVNDLISDLDMQLFKTEDLKFLREGIDTDKQLRYFEQILEKRARVASSPEAAAVQKVLQDAGGDGLPIKTAFCMALILTASYQENIPSTDAVS
ncbi:MAG: MFS transporter [Spirochaetia bacterium]|nr:MFS transporter [Spirochaetia bacterium]